MTAISGPQTKTILDTLSVVVGVTGMATDTLTLKLDSGEDIILSAEGGTINPVTPETVAEVVALLNRANAFPSAGITGFGTAHVTLTATDGSTVVLNGTGELFQADAEDVYILASPIYGTLVDVDGDDLFSDEGVAALLVGEGDSSVRFQADAGGEGGNEYSVEYIDPALGGEDLDIDLNTKKLTVSLATDGGGDITTTAQDIIDEVTAQGAGTLHLYAAVPNQFVDGTGVVVAAVEAFLTGGY